MNTVDQAYKTNAIPKLAGSWVKMKLSVWKGTLYHCADRMWFKWMQAYQMIGQKI